MNIVLIVRTQVALEIVKNKMKENRTIMKDYAKMSLNYMSIPLVI